MNTAFVRHTTALCIALLPGLSSVFAQQQLRAFVNVTASADTLLEPDELWYSVLLNPNALYGYGQDNYYGENLQQERESQMQLKRQQAQNKLQEYFKQAGISDKQLIKDPYSIDDPNTAMYRPYTIRFANKQQLDKLVKLLQGNELFTGRVAKMTSSKKEAAYEAMYAAALRKARDKAARMARTLGVNIGPVIEIEEINADVFSTPNTIYNVYYPANDNPQEDIDPSQYQYLVQTRAILKVKFALE